MKKIKKYVSVYISDEVPAKIDSDAVIDFLNQCSNEEFFSILNEVDHSIPVPKGIEILTLEDAIKFELLIEAFKLSLNELESKLK